MPKGVDSESGKLLRSYKKTPMRPLQGFGNYRPDERGRRMLRDIEHRGENNRRRVLDEDGENALQKLHNGPIKALHPVSEGGLLKKHPALSKNAGNVINETVLLAADVLQNPERYSEKVLDTRNRLSDLGGYRKGFGAQRSHTPFQKVVSGSGYGTSSDSESENENENEGEYVLHNSSEESGFEPSPAVGSVSPAKIPGRRSSQRGTSSDSESENENENEGEYVLHNSSEESGFEPSPAVGSVSPAKIPGRRSSQRGTSSDSESESENENEGEYVLHNSSEESGFEHSPAGSVSPVKIPERRSSQRGTSSESENERGYMPRSFPGSSPGRRFISKGFRDLTSSKYAIPEEDENSYSSRSTSQESEKLDFVDWGDNTLNIDAGRVTRELKEAAARYGIQNNATDEQIKSDVLRGRKQGALGMIRSLREDVEKMIKQSTTTERREYWPGASSIKSGEFDSHRASSGQERTQSPAFVNGRRSPDGVLPDERDPRFTMQENQPDFSKLLSIRNPASSLSAVADAAKRSGTQGINVDNHNELQRHDEDYESISSSESNLSEGEWDPLRLSPGRNSPFQELQSNRGTPFPPRLISNSRKKVLKNSGRLESYPDLSERWHKVSNKLRLQEGPVLSQYYRYPEKNYNELLGDISAFVEKFLPNSAFNVLPKKVDISVVARSYGQTYGMIEAIIASNGKHVVMDQRGNTFIQKRAGSKRIDADRVTRELKEAAARHGIENNATDEQIKSALLSGRRAGIQSVLEDIKTIYRSAPFIEPVQAEMSSDAESYNYLKRDAAYYGNSINDVVRSIYEEAREGRIVKNSNGFFNSDSYIQWAMEHFIKEGMTDVVARAAKLYATDSGMKEASLASVNHLVGQDSNNQFFLRSNQSGNIDFDGIVEEFKKVATRKGLSLDSMAIKNLKDILVEGRKFGIQVALEALGKTVLTSQLGHEGQSTTHDTQQENQPDSPRSLSRRSSVSSVSSSASSLSAVADAAKRSEGQRINVDDYNAFERHDDNYASRKNSSSSIKSGEFRHRASPELERTQSPAFLPGERDPRFTQQENQPDSPRSLSRRSSVSSVSSSASSLSAVADAAKRREGQGINVDDYNEFQRHDDNYASRKNSSSSIKSGEFRHRASPELERTQSPAFLPGQRDPRFTIQENQPDSPRSLSERRGSQSVTSSESENERGYMPKNSPRSLSRRSSVGSVSSSASSTYSESEEESDIDSYAMTEGAVGIDLGLKRLNKTQLDMLERSMEISDLEMATTIINMANAGNSQAGRGYNAIEAAKLCAFISGMKCGFHGEQRDAVDDASMADLFFREWKPRYTVSKANLNMAIAQSRNEGVGMAEGIMSRGTEISDRNMIGLAFSFVTTGLRQERDVAPDMNSGFVDTIGIETERLKSAQLDILAEEIDGSPREADEEVTKAVVRMTREGSYSILDAARLCGFVIGIKGELDEERREEGYDDHMAKLFSDLWYSESGGVKFQGHSADSSLSQRNLKNAIVESRAEGAGMAVQLKEWGDDMSKEEVIAKAFRIFNEKLRQKLTFHVEKDANNSSKVLTRTEVQYAEAIASGISEVLATTQDGEEAEVVQERLLNAASFSGKSVGKDAVLSAVRDYDQDSGIDKLSEKIEKIFTGVAKRGKAVMGVIDFDDIFKSHQGGIEGDLDIDAVEKAIKDGFEKEVVTLMGGFIGDTILKHTVERVREDMGLQPTSMYQVQEVEEIEKGFKESKEYLLIDANFLSIFPSFSLADQMEDLVSDAIDEKLKVFKDGILVKDEVESLGDKPKVFKDGVLEGSNIKGSRPRAITKALAGFAAKGQNLKSYVAKKIKRSLVPSVKSNVQPTKFYIPSLAEDVKAALLKVLNKDPRSHALKLRAGGVPVRVEKAIKKEVGEVVRSAVVDAFRKSGTDSLRMVAPDSLENQVLWEARLEDAIEAFVNGERPAPERAVTHGIPGEQKELYVKVARDALSHGVDAAIKTIQNIKSFDHNLKEGVRLSDAVRLDAPGGSWGSIGSRDSGSSTDVKKSSIQRGVGSGFDHNLKEGVRFSDAADLRVDHKDDVSVDGDKEGLQRHGLSDLSAYKTLDGVIVEHDLEEKRQQQHKRGSEMGFGTDYQYVVMARKRSSSRFEDGDAIVEDTVIKGQRSHSIPVREVSEEEKKKNAERKKHNLDALQKKGSKSQLETSYSRVLLDSELEELEDIRMLEDAGLLNPSKKSEIKRSNRIEAIESQKRDYNKVSGFKGALSRIKGKVLSSDAGTKDRDVEIQGQYHFEHNKQYFAQLGIAMQELSRGIDNVKQAWKESLSQEGNREKNIELQIDTLGDKILSKRLQESKSRLASKVALHIEGAALLEDERVRKLERLFEELKSKKEDYFKEKEARNNAILLHNKNFFKKEFSKYLLPPSSLRQVTEQTPEVKSASASGNTPETSLATRVDPVRSSEEQEEKRDDIATEKKWEIANEKFRKQWASNQKKSKVKSTSDAIETLSSKMEKKKKSLKQRLPFLYGKIRPEQTPEVKSASASGNTPETSWATRVSRKEDQGKIKKETPLPRPER